MDIKDVFSKAQKTLTKEIEKAKEDRAKEVLEYLLLEEKILRLYEKTSEYRENAHLNLAKAIQEDRLIQGQKVKVEHGKANKYMKEIECDRCGAELFNVLDKDYVELYKLTSYCLECALCGKRKWYRLDRVEFEEVKAVEEPLEMKYEMEYEEEEECEQ